ncbi:MAG: hypothetical protein GY857_09065 [Desulfobacula sp.]|nr:hypothetical protein [Desulfobacula sp.]
MSQDNKNAHFQIDGLFKLKKVGDYLKLVDKKVKLTFKETDSELNTKKIFNADVAGLSDTGTHLILQNVCVKRYIFFSRHIKKYIVPINNILTVQILDKYGKID